MRHIACLILLSLLTATSLRAQLPMPVYSVSSSVPAQPGTEADKCIDGDDATHYHSDWDLDAIPDTLDFFFPERVQQINALEYTPRAQGLNGVWTTVEIYGSTRQSPGVFTRLTADPLVWAADNTKKSYSLPAPAEDPEIIRVIVRSAVGNFSSCAEMRFYGSSPTGPDGSTDCSYDIASVAAAGDIPVPIQPAGSTASSHMPGEDIGKSFDGDFSTLYHSHYSAGPGVFPVTLNYRFDGNPDIDYMVYHPRSDGGANGNFGRVAIHYNTGDSGPDSLFQLLEERDMGQSGSPSVIQFPAGLRPRNIRVTVMDGYGDFASCAEMQFFKKDDSSAEGAYRDIFANSIYSALRPEVTQDHIDTIDHPFYRSLAQCILDGHYNGAFRDQVYPVYPTLNKTARELKISTYDAYENMTGIVFEPGEKVVLFVEEAVNPNLFLKIRDFADEETSPETSYLLKQGLNVFETSTGGLGYIGNYSDAVIGETRINILSGRINGYFDVRTSDEADWMRWLSNDAYPKIDLRGDHVHLVYDKLPLRVHTPFAGRELVSRYDTIVKHELILMGLYKYDRVPANRMFGWSETGGGYYASGTGAHFDLTWGAADLTSARDLGLWGIAHEFGHVNQVRRGLRWIGTTEVTTNVYSLWVYYHMNKHGEKYTRLESESQPAAPGDPAMPGGRFNGMLDDTYIRGRHLQSLTEDYHFRVLIPFWQLQLYYQLAGACRGADPLTLEEHPVVNGTDYARWHGTVAEIVRNTDETGLTNGQLLMNFIKNTCDAVQEDLTDYFTHVGLLRPVDLEIDDYGTGYLQVSQENVEEVIAYVADRGYLKPVSPVLHYISAHSMEVYRERQPLSGQTGSGATLLTEQGHCYLLIDHQVWKNAVAYETYDTTGQLVHVTISGTGDLSLQTTRVAYPADAGKVYAAGYDGTRIQVYPEETVSAYHAELQASWGISPNPGSGLFEVYADRSVRSDILELAVRDAATGKVILLQRWTEESATLNLAAYPAGTYLVEMRTRSGRSSVTRLLLVK